MTFIYCFIVILAAAIGYIIRDYQLYVRKSELSLKEGKPIKAGEYQPIYIKIDKNEMGGYTSLVYNRHGTHLTKENREHFVNILKYMIVKENEIRSHKFTLLTFKKGE